MSNLTTGTDNVLKDLGFGDEEAANLKIRADLVGMKFSKSAIWVRVIVIAFNLTSSLFTPTSPDTLVSPPGLIAPSQW
jgi:hypothetical protein